MATAVPGLTAIPSIPSGWEESHTPLSHNSKKTWDSVWLNWISSHARHKPITIARVMECSDWPIWITCSIPEQWWAQLLQNHTNKLLERGKGGGKTQLGNQQVSRHPRLYFHYKLGTGTICRYVVKSSSITIYRCVPRLWDVKWHKDASE